MRLRSLRTRLVLLFLASLALAAAVFAVVAVRQFNAHERSQSVLQLRKQAQGLASHFAAQQEKNLGKPPDAESTPVVYSPGLRDAIGARIYYARRGGLQFGTTPTNLARLPRALRGELDWPALQHGKVLTFDATILGKPHIRPEITGKYRMGDIRHCYADISLARKVLGYEPEVAFAHGLEELAQWLRGQAATDRVAQMRAELEARGLSA